MLIIKFCFCENLMLPFCLSSMTSRADENDKWASYAGPGGWNGNQKSNFMIFCLYMFFICIYKNVVFQIIIHISVVILGEYQILICLKLEMEG